MRDLFRRKEADHSRMEEERRHAGQAIPSCAGAQVFLLQWLGPHHVYVGVGEGKRASGDSLQVPPLPRLGLRFGRDGGVP